MPQSAEALKNEGNRLLGAGQVEAAIAAYRAALDLDPAYVPALNNLALTLKQTGGRREAEVCLRKAIEVAPDDAELHNNLAVLLHEAGRLDEALLAYGNALDIDPADGFANSNYGGLLSQTGRREPAIEYCRRATVAVPDSVAAWSTLGKVLFDAGRIDEALPVLEWAARMPGAGSEQMSALLYALLYLPGNAGGGEWPAYREFDRDYVLPRRASGFRGAAPAAVGRLRLGYLSGAIRSHATCFFIGGVFAHHDRAQIEVFLYDTAQARDEVSARLSGRVEHHVDCAYLADRALAERIRADRLDLLIDLDGHIGHNAQLALAWQPAPRQLAWLGYPHSTGSSAIDYWLTDRHIAGTGQAEPHVEQLVPMPDFYMVFDPGPAPPVTPLPAIRNGFVTFGSFNAPNKLNDDVLQAWAAVLRAVPESRLLVAASPGPDFDQRVLALLGAAGVAAARVRFAATCSHAEFLALHAEADVALDPFPVNGTTTSLFGLWMGLPLLTVAGQSHRARVGLSLMENLGMAEWIAASPDALVDCALRRCADLDGLAALRAGLRERVRQSPLCDGEGFTRNLERHLHRLCSVPVL